MCRELTPYSLLYCGHARSLSDVDRSTATNEGQASTLFSAPRNPHRIPANTPPVFRGLRPRICLALVRLVTNGNVGQAPGIYAVLHSGLARHAHRLCLDTRGRGRLGRTGTHFPPSQGSTGLLERSSGGLRRQSVDGPTTERRHENRNLAAAARSIDASRIRLDPITRPLHRHLPRIPRSRDRPAWNQNYRDRPDLRLHHTTIGRNGLYLSRHRHQACASLGRTGRRGHPYPPLYDGARPLLGTLLEPLLAALAVLVSEPSGTRAKGETSLRIDKMLFVRLRVAQVAPVYRPDVPTIRSTRSSRPPRSRYV